MSTMNNLQNRIANIERLRILAAYGVVTFHSDLVFSRHIGVVSFLCFAIIFAVFIINRPDYELSLGGFISKARRLLLPWLFWSAIFFVFLIVKSVLKGIPITELLSWRMLITGTSIHLWFLPFAFVSAVLIILTHQVTRHFAIELNVLVMFAFGLICAVVFSIIDIIPEVQYPFRQWILGFPAIPMGYAIGMSRFMKTRRHQYMFFIFSILSTCVIVCLIEAFGGQSRFIVRYCIALGVVCLAFSLNGKMGVATKTLSGLAYGIYLMHPLVISCFHFFIPSGKKPYVVFIMVILTTSILTYLMKKIPLKQFV